jgi:hypothetical protein
LEGILAAYGIFSEAADNPVVLPVPRTSMCSFVTNCILFLENGLRTVTFAVLSMISPKGHCKTPVVLPCSSLEPMKPMNPLKSMRWMRPMEMRLGDMQMSMGGGEPHEESTQHFCTECGKPLAVEE